MFYLTSHERKCLIFIGAMIIIAAAVRFFNVTAQGPVIAATETINPYTININTASYEELQRLPGVGPVLAQRVIAYRQNHGRFTSINEFKKVKGIGERKFEIIKRHIRK